MLQGSVQMSLATKYRPQTLDEVVGQEHIIKILKEEIVNDDIKHSYLLCGKTGCGKSTLSRIIANTLNAYLVEVDSASNNTSEDMENILNEVTHGKPVIYDNLVLILDECHCFSTKAISKLLLLLESLPSYLYVIMCTTEGDKILPTIKNRCECFNFLPVNVNNITMRLEYICYKEHFVVDNNRLLAEIAKSGNGSVRQAIANLELIAPNITIDRVKMIYDCSYDNFLNIVYSVSDKNLNEIINILNKVSDANKFTESFFSFLLDIKIYNNTNNMDLTTLPIEYEEDIKALKHEDMVHVDSLIDKLLNLLTEVKQSPIMKELLLANIFSEVRGQ
jgi:DNA polymerase-3 subunit gamma/tau